MFIPKKKVVVAVLIVSVVCLIRCPLDGNDNEEKVNEADDGRENMNDDDDKVVFVD